MSENEAQRGDPSVEAFLATVEPLSKRDEARVLDELFRRVTGEEPIMWGPSILGYGRYHYKYESGREGDWFRAGFSPRKAKHSLYLLGGYSDEETGALRDAALKRLGKHATGASCLYINKLADVDLEVLEEMVRADWEAMRRLYPE